MRLVAAASALLLWGCGAAAPAASGAAGSTLTLIIQSETAISGALTIDGRIACAAAYAQDSGPRVQALLEALCRALADQQASGAAR